MQDLFIIDHRARCRHCGEKPTYYSTTIGLSYHTMDAPGAARGGHRFKQDIKRYRNRDDIEFMPEKLVRRNSIRGVASVSSFDMKKDPRKWATARTLVMCPCGQSTWMYPYGENGALSLNRKLGNDVFNTKYIKTRYWGPAHNIGRY